MILLLALSGCVDYVPGGPPPQALATQNDTIALENSDRIARFQRLASIAGTEPPTVEQLYAPPGSVPDVPGAAPVVRVVFPESAFFASGSAEPRPEALAAMDLIAENMKRDVPDASLTLLGHTDAVGSDSSNVELSRRRAAAVMAGLIERGVPLGELNVVAIGKAQPIAPNLTSAGRARNRRVEFLISGSEQANLAVVTHRSVPLAYFRMAAARPPAPPPEHVALLVPDAAPAGVHDIGFLKPMAQLELARPTLVEPASEPAVGSPSHGLVEPSSE